jgi:hypothetical protein
MAFFLAFRCFAGLFESDNSRGKNRPDRDSGCGPKRNEGPPLFKHDLQIMGLGIYGFGGRVNWEI